MGASFVKSAMGVVSCVVDGGGAGVSVAMSPIFAKSLGRFSISKTCIQIQAESYRVRLGQEG